MTSAAVPVLQAIIGNYAVPILEEKQVWGTNDQTRTAYLDTTDVARMTLAALRSVPHTSDVAQHAAAPESDSNNKQFCCHLDCSCTSNTHSHSVSASAAHLVCRQASVSMGATAAALHRRSDATAGETMTLAGPQAYTVEEVIELCEKYAGADADVTKVPVWLLRLTRNLLRGFQWARDAADRLVSSMEPPPPADPTSVPTQPARRQEARGSK